MAAARDRFDRFFFYCYRYYHSYHGLPAVADRAILVPTAEEDPAIDLEIMKPLFRAPRGIVYLTPEEQALVEDASGNRGGAEHRDRQRPQPARGRPLPRLPPASTASSDRSSSTSAASTATRARVTLFAYFKKFLEESGEDVDLVLAGKPAVPIPDHPRIRHVGFITEEEKVAALRQCRAAGDALALREPVGDHARGLEAGRAGARERALQGAGGPVPALERRALLPRLRGVRRRPAPAARARTTLAASLGRQGQAYVEREYSWETIDAKLDELLARTG